MRDYDNYASKPDKVGSNLLFAKGSTEVSFLMDTERAGGAIFFAMTGRGACSGGEELFFECTNGRAPLLEGTFFLAVTTGVDS